MPADFTALHAAGRPLFLPNAWDVASAAALVEADFRAIGTTSLGVAAAAGIADGSGGARAETLALARRLRRLPVLLTVDVEWGFSDDPAEVAALVEELGSLGVVGVNIEDGRPDGTLADVADQVRLIRVVRERVPGVFLNARTDTFWLDPAVSLTVTLARCRAYADAGADGVFVPGLGDPAGLRAVAESVQVPLNTLAGAGGLSVGQLAELGVRRVSTGSLLFRAALGAAVEAAAALRRGGPPPPAPAYRTVQELIGRWPARS